MNVKDIFYLSTGLFIIYVIIYGYRSYQETKNRLQKSDKGVEIIKDFYGDI